MIMNSGRHEDETNRQTDKSVQNNLELEPKNQKQESFPDNLNMVELLRKKDILPKN